MFRSKKALFCFMVLIAALTGCDDKTTTTVLNQCETDSECADWCETDTFACNAGVCACTEVVVKAACTDDEDCTCTEGTASCTAGDCYCNTTTTETRPACSQDADCAPGCTGYDNAVCSAAGVCFCADAIPQEVVQCNADDDCTDGCAGYDTFSCSAGQCYCNKEAELQCHADDDCAAGCFGADSFACKGGMCHCTNTETETLPSCTNVSDCNCTEGTPSCRDNACYCTTEVTLTCEADGDCAAGCAEADTFACNAGLCHCTDIQVQEPTKGRVLIAVDPSDASYEIAKDGNRIATGTGTASLMLWFGDYTVTFLPLEGYQEPAPVRFTLSEDNLFSYAPGNYTLLDGPGCTEDTDCDCFETHVPRCFGGTCYCLDDPYCPALTRRELVSAFYVAFGYTGCPMTAYENLCPDIPDGLQACQWAALVGDGIVSPYTDASGNPGNCGPEDAVLRAAFVKMLMVAIDGLAGYEPPATPTFDDVAEGAWHFDWIEGALQLGLIRGYTDDQGNLTGLFGPGDVATTCWMDEVLRRAADGGYLPGNSNPAPILQVEVTDEDGAAFSGHFKILDDTLNEVFSGTGSTQIVGLAPGDYHIFFRHEWGFVTPLPVQITLPLMPVTIVATGVYEVSTFNVQQVRPNELVTVRGAHTVPLVTMEFEAKEWAVLRSLQVRFRADTGGFDGGFDDFPANQLVASATLYREDEVIAGPELLQPAVHYGADPYAFDPDTDDFYYVRFNGLDYAFEADTRTRFTVKVDFLNTPTQELFLYGTVSMRPGSDVNAEDADGNLLMVNGYTAQDNTFLPGWIMTVKQNGTLGYMLEETSSFVECAGFGGGKWATYAFLADHEDFVINKLTLVNDLTGSFGDSVEDTLAVNQVQIRYPDINGVEQMAYAPLINGQVTFRDLGFYVPAGEMVRLEISGNTHHMIEIGEALSGEAFRIGLLSDNTLATFEAVGQTTSTTLHDFNANWGGGTTYLPSFVRKAYPYFSGVTGTTVLVNGENTLFGFQANSSCGSVGFGRFTFQLTSTVPLSDFHFYRGSTLIDTANCVQVDDKVIVSFEQEEVITSGTSQNYFLGATVSGATVDDVVQTRMLGDSLELDLPNTCHANTNTGRVHDAGGAGIFTGPDGFSSIDVYGARVVWSDRSADAHAYPTVTDGLTEAGTGSCDWTNGYYLRIENLSPHTLTY